jgi:hypothetical protein
MSFFITSHERNKNSHYCRLKAKAILENLVRKKDEEKHSFTFKVVIWDSDILQIGIDDF